MEKVKPLAVVTLVTRLEKSEDIESSTVTDWLVAMLMGGVKSPGFWSGEILPPGRHHSDNWTVLQRFKTMEQAEAWRNSSARKILLEQLKDISCKSETKVEDEITSDASVGSAVTAIVTAVKPSMEEEYWAWEHKIHAAQAKFPGFGGVYVQPPAPGKPGQWTTLLRFDTPQGLENWFESTERRELLTEANKFVDNTRFHQVASTFPGFFPGEEECGRPTPKWKAALMVLIGLFPVLEVLRIVYTPWAAAIHIRLVLALALSTVLSVSMVSFVTMPLLVKIFAWWLAPAKEKDNIGTDLKGLAIVVVIFMCEILAAWQILVQ